MASKDKISDSSVPDSNRSGRRLVVTIAAAAASLFVITLPVSDLMTGLIVVALFAIVFLLNSIEPASGADRDVETPTDEVFDPDTEEWLQILEDAGLFLGSSLNLSDMFRLVSSRIEEIIPCRGTALFLPDSDAGFGRTLGDPDKIGARDLLLKMVRNAGENKQVFTEETRTSKGESAVAIPLKRSGEVFAVLVLGVGREIRGNRKYEVLIDAVASRLEPVLGASVALERSSTNSMTDPLTGLPNERAFRLVLENRLAEARRVREESKITVLAVDISGFAEINSSHGHNVGDKTLIFVGQTLSGELREMDLVARTTGDEFLVILPLTAEESFSAVTGRLSAAFSAGGPPVGGGVRVQVKLNFGAASFEKADQTAGDLIRNARAEREALKSGRSNQVLRFPTKYDN